MSEIIILLSTSDSYFVPWGMWLDLAETLTTNVIFIHMALTQLKKNKK